MRTSSLKSVMPDARAGRVGWATDRNFAVRVSGRGPRLTWHRHHPDGIVMIGSTRQVSVWAFGRPVDVSGADVN